MSSNKTASLFESWLCFSTPQDEDRWEKAWCVLRSDRLILYSSQETTSENRIYSLGLSESCSVQHVPTGAASGISLHLLVAGQHRITLKVKSSQERDLWKAKLQDAVSGFTSPRTNTQQKSSRQQHIPSSSHQHPAPDNSPLSPPPSFPTSSRPLPRRPSLPALPLSSLPATPSSSLSKSRRPSLPSADVSSLSPPPLPLPRPSPASTSTAQDSEEDSDNSDYLIPDNPEEEHRNGGYVHMTPPLSTAESQRGSQQSQKDPEGRSDESFDSGASIHRQDSNRSGRSDRSSVSSQDSGQYCTSSGTRTQQKSSPQQHTQSPPYEHPPPDNSPPSPLPSFPHTSRPLPRRPSLPAAPPPSLSQTRRPSLPSDPSSLPRPPPSSSLSTQVEGAEEDSSVADYEEPPALDNAEDEQRDKNSVDTTPPLSTAESQRGSQQRQKDPEGRSDESIDSGTSIHRQDSNRSGRSDRSSVSSQDSGQGSLSRSHNQQNSHSHTQWKAGNSPHSHHHPPSEDSLSSPPPCFPSFHCSSLPVAPSPCSSRPRRPSLPTLPQGEGEGEGLDAPPPGFFAPPPPLPSSGALQEGDPDDSDYLHPLSPEKWEDIQRERDHSDPGGRKDKSSGTGQPNHWQNSNRSGRSDSISSQGESEKENRQRYKNFLAPWFFDKCTREVAEAVLTHCEPKLGNTLLRAHQAGYAISRRTPGSKLFIEHYKVVKEKDGFRINVEDFPHRMATLEDVMEAFVRQTGAQVTRPMTCNDLGQLGIPGADHPPNVGQRRRGSDVQDRSQLPPPLPPRHP